MPMRLPLLAALAAASPALSQSLPAPVIDNARVTVRNIHLQKGKPGPVIKHAGFFAVLYFDGGKLKIADGHTVNHPAGDAVTGNGGATHDTALDKDQREIVVEFKNAPSNTVPNTTGLPLAFPREGSKLVMDSKYARVWNYTWVQGKPTVMHFHNTEVVVAYRGDGDITSTDPSGKATVNHRATGDIVYNLANRSHSEALTKGEVSGVMLELK
jgi:hypothetical protein